ncbi:hypothetical protein AB5L52_21025 [Streptomyces sp. CG4]|uniref:hypothetical protein n=1 Tax=Streptomyces sp. CG4 TaxID=408783 RepID=UPI0034E2E4E6
MAIVLAVPTCLLLALTGLGVADRAHDWSAARATEPRSASCCGNRISSASSSANAASPTAC